MKLTESENTRKIGSLEMQIATLHKEIREKRENSITNKLEWEVAN